MGEINAAEDAWNGLESMYYPDNADKFVGCGFEGTKDGIKRVSFNGADCDTSEVTTAEVTADL